MSTFEHRTPYLTVSTLGAPGESLTQIAATLDAANVRAVELRYCMGEIIQPGMAPSDARYVRKVLADRGIAVSGIASYVKVGSDLPDEATVGALGESIRIAAELGGTYVRVFPGGDPARILDSDSRAVRRLNAVATLAQELSVFPLLETHDSHPRGADIARVLKQVSTPVGAIWDVLHPWRSGEPLEETWRNLEPWLADGRGNVQVKDVSADLTPRLLGEGQLPLFDFASTLRRHNYQGYICLETERAWNPLAPHLSAAVARANTWLHSTYPIESDETRTLQAGQLPE